MLKRKNNTVFYIFFCAFILLNIFWIFYLRLLPFIDLPFHLAEATIFKNFDSFQYSDFYSIPSLLKSNTFHMFFTGSNIFPDVEFANKIYFSLYLILFPVSVLFLIKKLNGNIWFAFFSFFLIYNHNVHWGFVGYAMSVPVFLFYIYFCLKYFENRKGIYILILSLFLVLIFLMHFQTAIFGILVILVMAGFNKRKNIFFLLSVILIVLPVLIIMIYAYKLDANYENNGLFPYLFSYYLKEFIFSIPLRLKNLFLMDNFYFFEQPLGSIFAYIFSFIILLPVVIKFGEFKNIISVLLNKETDKEKQTNIISWETKYYLLLLIISLMCYFFLPDNIPGQNIIYERFSVFILIFTIIISGVIYKDAIPGFYKKTAIIIICGIYFTIISFYFIQFDNEANCFTKDIFPEVNSGKVLAGIIIDNDFKGRPVFTHFPMYYTVWKNGITTGLVDYRFGVIKRKADKEKLPVYKEWLDKDFVYNNEYNNVDYIIVKDKEETKISYYRIIKKCGEWRLFSVK